jgi:16S rRNA (cytidine1402-2'-O)-methyltransferase
MGKLLLVPTPLGNLGDITFRALESLKTADLILAEDTRTTSKLLAHYGIAGTKLKSFHLHNEHKVLPHVLELIRSNELVCLVSDAGTPGISDPGFLLVRACNENNVPVECLPGPTALIPALVISGFPSDRFIFEGFLPHKKGRQTRILSIKDETRTVVYYESPHRLLKTLEQCAEYLGPTRNAAVVRELSKMFEECVRGTLADLITHFKAKPAKGEIVLVIQGVSDKNQGINEAEND